jgi:hypothetical protein
LGLKEAFAKMAWVAVEMWEEREDFGLAGEVRNH